MATSLLRDWDEASKSRRKKLLTWFRCRFQLAPFSGELESEYGADVSLFFARVLVWMHKTTAVAPLSSNFKRFFALSEQLACIQIFLASANVHVYYREFQQANGLAMLIEVLQVEASGTTEGGAASDEDRLVVLDILLRISQRGRAHKEEISSCDGELAIIRGALASSERCTNMMSPLWEACRDTLLEQIVGNPTSVEQAHRAIEFMLTHSENELRVFGAQILRQVVTPDSFYLNRTYQRAKEVEIVSLAVEILQSGDIRLQHEGLELVHSLLQCGHLQSGICKVMVDWIRVSVLASELTDERFASVKSSREYETFSHMRSQFVRAAQSASTLMNSTPAIVPILVTELEILVPLSFAVVVERPQSLKWYAAAIAIHYLLTTFARAAAAHLAQLFSFPEKKLLAWKSSDPEHLARSLLQSVDHQRLLTLQFYQNGWRRPVELPPASPHPSFADDDEDAIDNELRQLELEVETAVRDFVPELQMRAAPHSFDPASDELDLYGDAMDAQREQQLRVGLQRHFLRFRSSLAGSTGNISIQS